MPPLAPAIAVLGGTTVALLLWWIGDQLAKVPTVRRTASGEGPAPNIVDALMLRTPVEFLIATLGASLDDLAATIDQKLIYAGRPFGGVTGREYVALLLVSTLIGIVVLAVLFALSSGNLLFGAIGGIFFGLMPAVYFWVYADDRMQNRKERLSQEFPYFLDLVVMTQQAQATLPESLRLYAEAAPGTVMAEEIDQTLKDIALGTGVVEALQRLERRVAADEVVRVLRAVIQGEIEGSNRLELLREHARELRFRRWERAERAGEVLRAKIVMPAMMIVVAILLLVLAPALVEMTGMF